MFVIKNRDIKILYKPDIDESRITDVYTNEEGEKCFDYDFFFNADLRAALNTGNFKVRLSIRKKPKEKTIRFMSDLTDVSPLGLVTSLFTKDSENKVKLRVNDKTGLVKRRFVDLTEYIPNFKVKNAKKLSDRALFGIVKKTNVFSAEEIKSQGIDINLPQRNLAMKKEISSKRFIQNYQIAIKNGVDPAVLTIPIDSMTKADPRTRGTFIEKREKKTSTVIQGARDTALSILEKNSINPIMISDMPKNSRIGLTVDQVDRVKIISKSITLKKKSLGANKFYVKLDVISKKGIIVQSMTMIIDHLQNLKDYYVPRDIVDIRAKMTDPSSQKRSVNLGVVIPDQTISGYSLFQRKLSPTMIYSLSQFYSIRTEPFRKKSSKRSTSRSQNEKPVRKRSNEIQRVKTRLAVPKGNCLYLTRVTTTGRLGTQYGNFNQASVKGGPILTNRLSFMTKCNPQGIELSLLSSVPNHISGMCYVRRDISHGVTRARWTMIRRAGSFPEKGVKGFTLIDTFPKEGRTYEYKIKIYMQNGVSRYSINSRFEKFIKPTEALIPSLTNFTTVKDTERSSISVLFNIAYSMNLDDADILMKLLSQAGLSDMYDAELSEIKDSLSALVCFRVERFNIASGETIDLGVATAGSFTDSYKLGLNPPALNTNYVYRVYPQLVSPSDVVDSLTSYTDVQSSPSAIGSTSAIGNPTAISRMRSKLRSDQTSVSSQSSRDESFLKNRLSTSMSGKSLRKGTLSSASESKNPLDSYGTGDYIDKKFSTGSVSVKVKPGKVTYGGHGGPIVRWSSDDSSNYVDYFAVIAKKQGSFQVVGNCCGYAKTSYTFIDYMSVGYVGMIDYFVVPITLDGSTSARQRVGSTVMIDTNTKFRRSN